VSVERVIELWRLGKKADAEQLVAKLIAAKPDDPAVLGICADLHLACARSAEAIQVLRRLAALVPTDAAVRRRLGTALIDAGAPAAAIPHLKDATLLEPSNARGFLNLGLALLRVGDAAAAVSSLETAVGLNDRNAISHFNLGMAYKSAQRPGDARRCLERAIEIDPHFALARAELGALLRIGDAAAADAEENRALESFATNLMTARRYEEAVAVFTQLLARDPNYRYAAGTRFHCQLHVCDWSQYAESVRSLDLEVRAGKPADLPFSYFVYSDSAEAQSTCSRTYIAEEHPARPRPTGSRRARDAASPITVAYLSLDFYQHATSHLIAGLLEAHDRARFRVIAMSYGPDDNSAVRARLIRAVDEFIDVSNRSDDAVAELLEARSVDVAVDLKGLTGGARTGIFARRGAPVQINFLGYPGTMGAEYIDYLIADRIVVPAHARAHYAEQIVEMPHCYQPNDRRRPLPRMAEPRSAYGLPDGGFVLCAFNNVYKITPAVFAAWMELLRSIDGAVLWLAEGPAGAAARLRAAAEQSSVNADRLVFAPNMPLAEHLARYLHADLFLDTYPCNAHTTASDALWMGVPIVTRTGDAFASRVATSLLHTVGLPQLCVSSQEEYVACARRLAHDPVELARLHAHLEEVRANCPLFDTERYCRHLEHAYAVLVARHELGERPAPLQVQP